MIGHRLANGSFPLRRDMSRIGRPSPREAERHLLDLQDVLAAVREGGVEGTTKLPAWPAGLDRSILRGLPLRTRTWNCLHEARLLEGDDPLTVGQLLSVQRFGWKSLEELLFTVEQFLNECIHGPGPLKANDPAQPASGLPEETVVRVLPAEERSALWDRAGEVLAPLFATAAELHGIDTLADALSPECRRLASEMGIGDEVKEIRIDRLTEDVPGLAAMMMGRLTRTLETVSGNAWKVIEDRLLRTPPDTLEEIGSRLGLTRERIRQIQVRTEEKIRDALGEEFEVIASILQEQLGPVVPESEFERRMEAIAPAASEPLARGLFRRAIIDRMGLVLEEGTYSNEQTREVLADIRVAARTLADEVGLVDEERLVAQLPGEEWRRLWPWLRERVGLHDLHGVLGLRDTMKARVKAALLSLGRPATRREVASICGLEPERAGTRLSSIPGVVRADKHRWALREWVDDEYDGIVGEIIQRIEEDGGLTTTERLLRELPDRFGVSPSSVRAYMRTSRFVVRDGGIRLANPSSVRLRDLDDVIDGRDDAGAPYWTFTVQDHLFKGYSVPFVPPEFAHALGCAPDGAERLRIENLPDARELSLRWRLASVAGASIGRLGQPLQQLGLRSGQRMRVTIRGRCLVRLSAEDG